jgi:hypothetical protein
MAQVVGQHQVATFTDPQNGQSPIDATQVRTNDNALRGQYVDHDADPGIHLQSSALASRPAAGTAGRKWLTMDSGSYRLFVDDGSNWQEVTYLRTDANGTVTGNLTVTGNVVVEGDTTLGNANTDAVTVTGRVASNVEFGTDDTHDVGASGANRPRTVYAGTSVVTPLVTATTLGGTLSTAAQTNITSVGTLSALTVTGAATAGKLVPTANTVTGNGMYLPTTNVLAFSTNGVEAARIDASGNVGIGGTPITKFQVRPQTDANIGVQSSTYTAGGVKINSFNNAGNANVQLDIDGSAIAFGTGGSERARITAGGDFQVTNAVIANGPSNGAASIDGSTAISIANGAAAQFPVYRGMFVVTDLTSGETAIVIMNNGAGTVVSQTGSSFTGTVDTGSKVNVFASSGTGYVQNNLSTRNFAIFILKTT